MPSRNTKSKQLKKRAKNTVGIYRVLWPEVSFSIVYLKYMKKKKFLPKLQERPPFLTQILKIAECGRGRPLPTPTSLARVAPSVQAIRA